jgi:exodeoxyribonuclease VII small subunit
VTEKPELSFEAALKQLEEVVQRLEKGEPTLEESLQLYEQGVKLSRLCQQKLEEAQGKVEMLLKDERGEPVTDAKGRPKTAPLDTGDEGGA